MKACIFDEIEDDTENYKNKIRGVDYANVVRDKTHESIVFIFYVGNEEREKEEEREKDENEEKDEYVKHEIKVDFDVEFVFSFKKGFSNVKFSDFRFTPDNFDVVPNMQYELIQYIKETFMNVDRLSE